MRMEEKEMNELLYKVRFWDIITAEVELKKAIAAAKREGAREVIEEIENSLFHVSPQTATFQKMDLEAIKHKHLVGDAKNG